jgi:hypothetical protein
MEPEREQVISIDAVVEIGGCGASVEIASVFHDVPAEVASEIIENAGREARVTAVRRYESPSGYKCVKYRLASNDYGRFLPEQLAQEIIARRQAMSKIPFELRCPPIRSTRRRGTASSFINRLSIARSR